MKEMNPFIITGDYVSPDYFCDREFESTVLDSNIRNGRNTVLISPRRMGKTGLISHVLHRESICHNFKLFSIDLYPTSSLSEMVMMLSKEIVASLKSPEKKLLVSFISVVKSLRPGFKMDPVSGSFVFDLSLGEIIRPEDSLKEIFEYLEQSDMPCVVAIDEFQQIADYPEKNTLALLRSYMQKCSNTWFIFAGSKRRMMEKLFNSPSEPFYQSCSPLYLDVISKDTYRNFAMNHFRKAAKSLDEDCFDSVYDCFYGHTWYVQRVLNELYAVTDRGETAVKEDVPAVLDYIIKLGAKSFEEQFHGYSDNQKQLLIAVAKENIVKGITSAAFVKHHNLKSPSSVQSALRSLYEDETISKDGDSYFITNHLFKFWLRKKYGYTE